MSYWTAIGIQNNLGEDYASKVMKWKKKVEDWMKSESSQQVH